MTLAGVHHVAVAVLGRLGDGRRQRDIARLDRRVDHDAARG
jgi:hypothetical protein